MSWTVLLAQTDPGLTLPEGAGPLEITYAVVVFLLFAVLAYEATRKAKPRRQIRPPQP